MLKVVKFGGSSLADAAQFEKVRQIITADPARRVVVVSAPGKRFSADHKITDLLYLCYAHLQKPDWKKALEYAEKFSTRDDKIISPESQVALADIYVNNDQTDKAIETLKKAAEMADSRADGGVNLSVAPLALLKAGQLLESKNKKAEALEVYKSIKQKYVASPLYQEIDKYIERASR